VILKGGVDHDVVSAFHPLGNETMKHAPMKHGGGADRPQKINLRALADQWFQNHSKRNTDETNNVTAGNADAAANPPVAAEKPPVMTAPVSVTSTRKWLPSDWRDKFEEAAAYVEFDCGETRAFAEARAYVHCVRLWLSRNPPTAFGANCYQCQVKVEAADSVLLACADGKLRRIHSMCCEAFRLNRVATAVERLRRLGIIDPVLAEREPQN
jgi:hypothetical protein